mgnify:FL=1
MCIRDRKNCCPKKPSQLSTYGATRQTRLNIKPLSFQSIAAGHPPPVENPKFPVTAFGFFTIFIRIKNFLIFFILLEKKCLILPMWCRPERRDASSLWIQNCIYCIFLSMLKPEKFQKQVWWESAGGCLCYAQASIPVFPDLGFSQDLNIRKTGWKLRNIYIKYCLLLLIPFSPQIYNGQ